MEKKIYLNNTSLEDLELIKNDIKNLNDFYSKTFKPNIETNFQQLKQENNIKKESVEDSPSNQKETKKIIKDSRELSSPIIKPEFFYNYMKSETKSKFIPSNKLTSFNYKTLEQTFSSIGSYPDSARKYIWMYLLSLPNNTTQFTFYSGKGIHPLYANLEKNFPINENQMLIRIQKLCSLISFWSIDVGKIDYLVNIIYPFAKCFPGDDLFVFETVMSLIISIYKYFLEFYPNFPVTHIKLIEDIIKKETNNGIEKIFNYIEVPLNQLIWRLIKFLFSESFKKEDWLSFIYFLITYNHRPEMILYFTSAFLILLKNDININIDITNDINIAKKKEIRKKILRLILDDKPRREMKKIFNLSIFLYKKYSKSLQEFIFEPYMPQEFSNKYRSYKSISNNNTEFYGVIEGLKNEINRGDMEYDIGRQLMMNDDYQMILEKKYRELCNLEKEIEYCRKDILEQEKRKNEILKWELDIISHQRDNTIRKIEAISNNNNNI